MFPPHILLHLTNMPCLLLPGPETWILLVSQRTSNYFPLGSQARGRAALWGAALMSLHEKSRTASSEGRLVYCGRWVLLLWCTAPSLLITLHTLQMCRDGLRNYFSKKSPLNRNGIKLLQKHSLL